MSDVREALEAAIKGAETSTAPAEMPAAVESATPPPEVAAETKSDSKARNEDGTYAPKAKKAAESPQKELPASKEGATTPPPAAAVTGAETPKAEAPAEVLKAPQSWKPAVREEWAKLPPAVQGEVLRIERDTKVALQQAAEARKANDAYQQALAPYMPMLQAEGATPAQAIGSVFQTVAALRTGTPQQKAGLVAEIIKGYGVDVQGVADALDGAAPTQAAPPQYRDPRVDELYGLVRTAAERREAATVSDGQRQLDAFTASGKGEFLEDVKPAVVAILQAAMIQGLPMDLEKAYTLAVSMDPELSKVQAQREAASRAATAQAATHQKLQAAASVKTNPGGEVAPKKPDTVRGALEAAIAAHR